MPNHNWLVRLLDGYLHLRTGAPFGQFRDHDPESAAVPHWRSCAYCNSGKACTHEAPRGVDKHAVTKEAIVSLATVDPMLCRQLAIDLDRVIDGLPGKARELFHMRYRVGTWDVDQHGNRIIRSHNLAEVARQLHIRSMADVIRCHDYHLANMAAQLIDWAPRHAQQAA